VTIEPVFLTLDEVIEIHRDQIARYGGGEGICDLGLLNSPLAMPTATFGGQFIHAHLHEMAAAYLFHLVQNHPFIDGNKRVGAVAANVFLFLNDIHFAPQEDEYTELVLGVASGEIKKPAITEFLRTNSRPIQQ
jgi:death on curing protein